MILLHSSSSTFPSILWRPLFLADEHRFPGREVARKLATMRGRAAFFCVARPRPLLARWNCSSFSASSPQVSRFPKILPRNSSRLRSVPLFFLVSFFLVIGVSFLLVQDLSTVAACPYCCCWNSITKQIFSSCPSQLLLSFARIFLTPIISHPKNPGKNHFSPENPCKNPLSPWKPNPFSPPKP